MSGEIRATIPAPVWLSTADLAVIAGALAHDRPRGRSGREHDRTARRVSRALERRRKKARGR